ncbi:MAG: dTDP-4-dehydrorhamnose 3,5-epimerase family protein [Opitutae bacterium]|nr:dTDP-4-dehydrorhamnose 3,5-epimerase family protein [Opitutae bacterium]
MKTRKTTFNNLFVLERIPHSDKRGSFTRLFCDASLPIALSDKHITQENHSFTHKKGIVRGLHFQYPPHSEVKIVTCLKGEIYDVVVDLRKGSSTFLQHYSIILKEGDDLSLFIPEGFAHGFQTLSNNCELLYFHTAAYEPKAEGGINALDSTLEIDWPLKFEETSEKDHQIPPLPKDFAGLVLR